MPHQASIKKELLSSVVRYGLGQNDNTDQVNEQAAIKPFDIEQWRFDEAVRRELSGED